MSKTMADAYVIRFRGRTAGLAVRELSSYVFYTSDFLFQRIDGRKYRSLKALHTRVSEIFESMNALYPDHPALAAFLAPIRPAAGRREPRRFEMPADGADNPSVRLG